MHKLYNKPQTTLIQGSYTVCTFMNSMKFKVAIWKSINIGEFYWIFSGGAKLLYASIFFMQVDEKL